MAAAAGRVAGGSDEDDEDAEPIIEVEHTLFADAASAQEHGHHHGHDHGSETAEAGMCPCGSGKQLADCHGHAHEAQNDELLSDLLPHVDAGGCGLGQDDGTDMLDDLELV